VSGQYGREGGGSRVRRPSVREAVGGWIPGRASTCARAGRGAGAFKALKERDTTPAGGCGGEKRRAGSRAHRLDDAAEHLPALHRTEHVLDKRHKAPLQHRHARAAVPAAVAAAADAVAAAAAAARRSSALEPLYEARGSARRAVLRARAVQHDVAARAPARREVAELLGAHVPPAPLRPSDVPAGRLRVLPHIDCPPNRLSADPLEFVGGAGEHGARSAASLRAGRAGHR